MTESTTRDGGAAGDSLHNNFAAISAKLDAPGKILIEKKKVANAPQNAGNRISESLF